MEFDDPFRNFLGCEVEEVREGYARVKAVVREEFLNMHGIAHGGLIMALADFAFAISANTDARRVFRGNDLISEGSAIAVER